MNSNLYVSCFIFSILDVIDSNVPSFIEVKTSLINFDNSDVMNHNVLLRYRISTEIFPIVLIPFFCLQLIKKKPGMLVCCYLKPSFLFFLLATQFILLVML